MTAVFDFDDHHELNNAMPWMVRLKEINPAFKATLFAVPGLGSETFWDNHPSWIQLAPHGWTHDDSYECLSWSRFRMEQYLDEPVLQRNWAPIFKSPGWQINEDIYAVLLERGWAVADQHLEDHRRPDGLRTYFYEDSPDRWHGHVQNLGTNGIEETWDALCARVSAADGFMFASEAAVPWVSQRAA